MPATFSFIHRLTSQLKVRSYHRFPFVKDFLPTSPTISEIDRLLMSRLKLRRAREHDPLDLPSAIVRLCGNVAPLLWDKRAITLEIQHPFTVPQLAGALPTNVALINSVSCDPEC